MVAESGFGAVLENGLCREIETVHARLASASQANLRVDAGHDQDTVRREEVDDVRALAGQPGLFISGYGRLVTLASRSVEPVRTEFVILRALSLKAGQILTHEALLVHFCNGRNNGNQKVMHTFVKKLRTMLGGDSASPSSNFNMRGASYRMPRPGEPLPP